MADWTASRRRLLQLAAAGAAGALLAPALADRFGAASWAGGLAPRAARANEAWEAYHGVSAAVHQANFDRLSAQGFRLTSISVYGDAGNPLYAAVWVQRDGPAWMAVHGVSGTEYQTFFDTQTAAGFAPVIVSATGPFANAVFAALFEQNVPAGWVARHGMTPSDFQNENTAAANGNRYLRSMAIYGTASDRRYAGVWYDNSQNYLHWFWHSADSAATYQQTFLTETSIRGYRPGFVTLSSDEVYASVFTDQWLGTYIARHGLSAADYQAEFNAQTAAGLRPILVQGGGSSSNPVYAAIFAQGDDPVQWEVLYDGVGSRPRALTVFDDLINNFMHVNGIHAAQLTLLQGGAVKYALAFTRREVGSDYQVVSASDCFRLASCTKIFLEAAVQTLYNADPSDPKHLTPDTKVYPLLGFSNPKDPRSDTITIQQLLDHVGGYDDSSTGSNFDPTFQMLKIAQDLKLTRAVTKQDVMQYMYARPLDYTPGSPPPPKTSTYSNYGYLLAGAVVANKTGMSFFDYVNSAVLQPLGLTQVQLSPTAKSAKPANEPPYECPDIGPNALDPTSTVQVPAAYGGAGHILEVADSDAGIAASATALATLIHTYKVWGNGLRSDYAASDLPAAREGSDPGTLSYACSRPDGVDWAVIFNSRDWATATDTASSNLANAINALLDSTPLS